MQVRLHSGCALERREKDAFALAGLHLPAKILASQFASAATACQHVALALTMLCSLPGA